MIRITLSLALALFALAPMVAQPIVATPNFSVRTFGGPIITTELTSMAVDATGNIFLVDEPGTPAVGARVHRIRPDGTIDPFFAAGFSDPGELTYNPADGRVYLVDTMPVLTVINSRVWRMDQAAATLVRNVPVSAQGFTIDNAGQWYFGGVGLQGPGLYKMDPNANAATFLTAGHGRNGILQSLVSDDVIISDGLTVRRWSPGTAGTVPFFQPGPVNPNQIKTVTSLARGPFNQLGAGSMIGVRDFVTTCFCGQGIARDTGLTGGNVFITPNFASEAFGPPHIGFAVLANGVRNDLYWASVLNGIVGPQVIVSRITQDPSRGAHGSLFARVTPTTLTIDVYGRVAGGDAFTLGFIPASGPGLPSPLFVPGYTPIDLNPFASNYTAIIDGIGLLGAPNPIGVIPVSGNYSLSVTLPPPGSINLTLDAQALMLDDVAAPNGAYTVSNVETFRLP